MPISDVTNVNFLGLSITLLMGILIILVPRKYASIPLLITACFITLGQRVMVGSLHFYLFRVLILFGWIRLIVKREIFPLRFNAIDKVIIYYIIAGIVTYTILWQTSAAFINRMGLAYNTLGIYFLFRYLIRDFEDMIRIIKCLAVIAVPLALAAFFENVTGRNLFAIFGGVPEFTRLRYGNVRCNISFGDAILAGTFAATLMPLFIGLFFGKGFAKKLAIFGVAASTIITVLTHSSGPVMSYSFGIIGFMMWPFRKKMRTVRWGILASLIFLHIVMKAPVWALIGRLSELIGGTGYHRVELINAFIQHFWEWWLIGTKYTAHWGPDVLVYEPNMVDTTSQYILIGIEGGLAPMFLFIAIIAYSFRAIGRAIQATQGQSALTRIFLWSMGVALLGHTTSFISISYFSQIVVFWYMLLAMISACDGIFNKGRDPSKEANFSAQTVYQSE
jgi:hypothetical protein